MRDNGVRACSFAAMHGTKGKVETASPEWWMGWLQCAQASRDRSDDPLSDIKDMMNRFSRTAAIVVLLAASGAASAATTLCNRPASDPCAIQPSWGDISPDTKPIDLKPVTGAPNAAAVPKNASAAAGRTLTTSLMTAPMKSSLELDSLLLAIKGATFDRQNNVTGGKEGIRSAVEALRKVEPRRARIAHVATRGHGLYRFACVRCACPRAQCADERVVARQPDRARCRRTLAFGPSQRCVPEAVDHVIVHEPGRLQIRIDDGGAHELEAASPQILR
jgi:hypothetical protein